jgi:hypothetical protein
MQELHRTDESSWSSSDVREKKVMTVFSQKRAKRHRVHLMVKEVSRVEYSVLGPRSHHFHTDRCGAVTHR